MTLQYVPFHLILKHFIELEMLTYTESRTLASYECYYLYVHELNLITSMTLNVIRPIIVIDLMSK